MTDEPEDANDVLREQGADAMRDMFDKAERKVIPFGVVEPTQPPRLRPIDMARWDSIPVPQPDWTVLNRVPRRQTALFSGEGAMGKSTLLLQLCAAHAVAKDWLGVMPEVGPAIFIDAEDDQDVIHRRLAAIAAHYHVTFNDLVNGGLSTLSLCGEDAILASTSRSGKVEGTPLYNELLAMVCDVKPVMIGMASAANFFAGNENDRGQVQQFISLITRLAIMSNGSVVLVSHPSLTGVASGSGMSGSTQWHNAVRARFFLHGVKQQADAGDGGAEPDNDLREIEFKKNNYGPIADKITLQWRDGMFLPMPKQSPLAVAAQASRDEEMFTKLLIRFTEQHRPVGPKKGTIFAPSIFAGTDDAKKLGITNDRFRAAMERLLAAGRIRIEVFGPPSKQRIYLVVS